MNSKIGQLLSIATLGMVSGNEHTYRLRTEPRPGGAILNTRPREKSLGGDNKKTRPGAQIAHIRAAHKARNQRRARVANRRAAK